MQIINKDVNGILAEASHIPMLGIASGVARVILAIMQVALNIFLFVPSLFLSCCVDKDSSLHIGNVVSDVFNPIAHIIRGIIECGLPGSCFILGSTDYVHAPNYEIYRSDKAFSPFSCFD